MTQNIEVSEYDWPLISSKRSERIAAGRNVLRAQPHGLPPKPWAKVPSTTRGAEAMLAAALRHAPATERATPGAASVDEGEVLRWWLAGAGVDPDGAGVGRALLSLLANCKAAGLPASARSDAYAAHSERLAIAVALFRVIRRSEHRHALIDLLRGAPRKPPVRDSEQALSICLGAIFGAAPSGWTGVDDKLFAEVNLLAAGFVKHWCIEEALGAGALGESPGKLAACEWVWRWQVARRRRAREAVGDPRNADFLVELLSWLPESDSHVLVSQGNGYIAFDRTDMNMQLVGTGPYSRLWGPSLEIPMTSEGPALMMPKKVGRRTSVKGPGSRLLMEGYRAG
jgi:hypothetical protein